MGIDVQHCISVPDAFTMSAYVTVETELESRCCLMHKDVKMFEYDTYAQIQAVIKMIKEGKYDAVYTDGYQLDLVLPVVRAANKAGVPILADVEALNPETRELAHRATELIAPLKTICTLSGLSTPAEAVLALADRPGRTVVGTAGKDGSYGARYGDTEASYVPAYAGCQAKDTVGAGDAYHAGSMAATARGYSTLDEQMKFATLVAAALCETPGPVVSRESLRRYGLLPEKKVAQLAEEKHAQQRTYSQCALL